MSDARYSDDAEEGRFCANGIICCVGWGLLLGALPLGRALLFRKLKVSGSKSQAMKLESLVHACQSAYPDIAAERLGT